MIPHHHTTQAKAGKERDMITYPTRYQAEKARIKGVEIVVKVCGGYAVMTYHDYYIWRKQR